MNQIIDAMLNIRNDAFGFFDQVFLFGSSLFSDEPHDIDIILVYEACSPERVNFEKGKVEQVLTYKFADYTLDFTTLSISELNQTDFLMKVPHRKIKG